MEFFIGAIGLYILGGKLMDVYAQNQRLKSGEDPDPTILYNPRTAKSYRQVWADHFEEDTRGYNLEPYSARFYDETEGTNKRQPPPPATSQPSFYRDFS